MKQKMPMFEQFKIVLKTLGINMKKKKLANNAYV